MWKFLLFMWTCRQIEADFCKGLQGFIGLLNSAAFKIILHARAVNQTEHNPLLLQVNPQPEASHVAVINIITWQVSKHHQAM